ncbi:deoxyribose-phosphate aldolase [Coniochaeta sp. PMI_546]|nr:deoxyribose-phosphate aldolase [Coniochaeta sp. PMI_546]
MATITVSLGSIAKLIDHSLLHPTMTDAEIEEGLAVAKKYNVAAACIKPYSIPAARRALAGTDVLICSVIGFPHGNSTTSIKVAEAREAVLAGAHEIDMVVNIGKVLGGDWGYVHDEIKAINDMVTSTRVGGQEGFAVLKVIFENDYLQDEHIVKLCKICTDLKVAFIKTSTGYGFVKQSNGFYSYKGATVPHLKLMKENSGPDVKIKAAGGVRTLDEFLYVMWLGISRVGASATVAIMEEAKARGISDTATVVEVKMSGSTHGGTY